MPTLNMRLSQPRLLIDINRLRALSVIELRDGHVRIGALARHADVAASATVARHLPLIAEAMPHVAHVAVRNRGTFGGSIALADPAAEMPACALSLGATLVLMSTAGRREVPATDYFEGLYQTARRPDELLVEALVPVQQPASISVFNELAQRHGDFAIAGVAFNLKVDGRTVSDARLVYFGSEDKPTLAPLASAAIAGHNLDDASAIAAAEAALEQDLSPMESPHASSRMRLHLQRVLTRRALATAAERASGA
jgi:carbon-monoxide dehydrogenase medium subunit